MHREVDFLDPDQVSERLYRFRVADGMRFLDEVLPDWLDRVVSPFNLASPTGCVLCHVTGKRYADARVQLNLSILDTINLGFAFLNPDQRRYQILTYVWAKEIARRRNPTLRYLPIPPAIRGLHAG